MSLFCIIILMVEFRSAVIAEWFYVTVLYNYTNGGISFRSHSGVVLCHCSV